MATKKTTTESPMMMQFNNLKAKHPDALLLFRCGNFYETYKEDAEDASKILGITLTKRTTDRIPMAGFPHHALDTYLPKLIRAGKRVAICDQVEQPNNRAVEVVDDIKPAEKPADPMEKQPEDMTIAELMAAYKKMADIKKSLEAQCNTLDKQLMDAQARAEVAEKKLEAITNINMFEIKKLKCDTLYCMCNLNGYCAHRQCPKTNKDYRMPLEVAKEVEVQMQEQLRIKKELKNLKK